MLAVPSDVCYSTERIPFELSQLLARSVMLPHERSPRQLSQLLRLGAVMPSCPFELEELETLRATLDRHSQRVSLTILVAALLLSAS